MALLAVAGHCLPELLWSALELCEEGREHWDFLRAGSAAQGLKEEEEKLFDIAVALVNVYALLWVDARDPLPLFIRAEPRKNH